MSSSLASIQVVCQHHFQLSERCIQHPINFAILLPEVILSHVQVTGVHNLQVFDIIKRNFCLLSQFFPVVLRMKNFQVLFDYNFSQVCIFFQKLWRLCITWPQCMKSKRKSVMQGPGFAWLWSEKNFLITYMFQSMTETFSKLYTRGIFANSN